MRTPGLICKLNSKMTRKEGVKIESYFISLTILIFSSKVEYNVELAFSDSVYLGQIVLSDEVSCCANDHVVWCCCERMM